MFSTLCGYTTTVRRLLGTIFMRGRNLWVGIEMIRCCRKGGRLRRKNSKNLKGQQKICHEGHFEHAFERVMVDLVVVVVVVVWSVSLLRKFCMLDERVDSFLVIRTTSLALLAGCRGEMPLLPRSKYPSMYNISTLPCITPWHGSILTALTGGP